MKKFSLIFTLAIMASLLLAACGGATNTGTELTPTSDLGAGLETTPTSELGTGLETTPTAEGTLALETPTAEANTALETPTAEATTALETPTAEVGMGTGTSDQYILLSQLLGVTINGMDGQEVGMVNGAVVNRPIAVTGDMDTGTDDSAGVEATGTPEADTDSDTAGDTGSDSTAILNASRVSYLVVNLTGAIDDTAATGSDDSATGATETPEADEAAGADVAGTPGTVLIPWQAFAWDSQSEVTGTMDGSMALTLNVDSAALASAPTFDGDLHTAVATPNWDNEVAQFWGDQGVAGVPVTGPEAANEESAVIEDLTTGYSISDAAGADFATVKDFVIERHTGEIVYAILANTAGDSFYAVPLANLEWAGGQGLDQSATAAFNFSGEATALDMAPSFSSIDQFDFNQLGEVDTYWQSQSGSSLNK